MTPSAPARVRSFLVAAIAAIGAATTSSCSIATHASADPIGALPTKTSFTEDGVSGFMEVRCGSLDCHGQVGRPLRLYSQWGLRLKAAAGGARNGTGTTADERLENYRSVVGLDPENLAKCFASEGDNVDTFQLLKKPLDISGSGIRHKGGPVLRASETDRGWQCLFGWASGKVDKADCAAATPILK